MKFFIRKCVVCKEYTLREIHCNTKTICPYPLKYSPLDKYAKYRRREENEK